MILIGKKSKCGMWINPAADPPCEMPLQRACLRSSVAIRQPMTPRPREAEIVIISMLPVPKAWSLLVLRSLALLNEGSPNECYHSQVQIDFAFSPIVQNEKTRAARRNMATANSTQLIKKEKPTVTRISS